MTRIKIYNSASILASMLVGIIVVGSLSAYVFSNQTGNQKKNPTQNSPNSSFGGGDIVEHHDIGIYLFPSSDNIPVDQINHISIEVRNYGTFNETNVNVSLYQDGVSVYFNHIDFIELNQSIFSIYEWIPSVAGFVNFSAEITWLFNETNYNNNYFELIVSVFDPGDIYLMDSVDYSWYDAVANGYNTLLSGDDTYYSLTLPFTFNFYDSEFTQLYVSSNGWMSFENERPYDFSNVDFPSEEYPYAIAPFWDDLIAQSNIYIWSTAEFLVLQYNDYYHLNGELAGTFEVVLFATGEILFQYRSINNDYGATIGLNMGHGSQLYNQYTESLNGISNFALFFSKTQPEHDIAVFMEIPLPTTIGDTHTINYTVINRGLMNETDVSIQFYMDGEQVFSDIISTLNTGQSVHYSFEFVPYEFRTYLFYLVADPVVNETRFLNNEINRTLILVNNYIPMEVGDKIIWRTHYEEYVVYFFSMEVIDAVSPTEYYVEMKDISGIDGHSSDNGEVFTINPYTRQSNGFDLFPYWINTDDLYIGKMIQIFGPENLGEVVGFNTFDYNGYSIDTVEINYGKSGNLYYDVNTGIFVLQNHETEDYYFADLIYTNIFDNIPLHHNLMGGFSYIYANSYSDQVSYTSYILNTGDYTEYVSGEVLALDYSDSTTLKTYNLNLAPGDLYITTNTASEPDIPSYGYFDLLIDIETVSGETYLLDNNQAVTLFMGDPPALGTISITVYDESGTLPLVNAGVQLKNHNFNSSLTIFTDADGITNFVEVPLGKYTVTIYLSGYKTYSFDLSISYDNLEQSFTISLDNIESSDDTNTGNNHFSNINIPGYDLGILIGVVGLTAFLLKRKRS